MTPKLLLRIAAGSLVFLALGHTVGAMMFPVSRGPEEVAAFAALAAFRFDMMGFQRSNMDFFLGEGWFLSLSVIVFIALLLQVASLSDTHPDVARRLIPALFVFCGGSTVLCALYFFTAPLVTSVIATVAVAGAGWMLRAR